MAVSSLNFAASVDDWCRQTQQRMEAVFRTAAQFTIEEVIDRTPVDTGFLRASLMVNTSGIAPINRAARPAAGGVYQAQPYALAIAGAELGDTIFASFVASYAGYVEYGAQGRPARGMVRLAAQSWPQNVNRAVQAAKAAVSGRSR